MKFKAGDKIIYFFRHDGYPLDLDETYTIKDSYITLEEVPEEFFYYSTYFKLVEQNEKVNNPKHYNKGKIEVIDFIEDQNLGFCLGNVVKYICRSDSKNETPLEDLKKARYYINREIKKYEK